MQTLRGLCKLIVTRNSNLILGGHVVSEQAVEIVQLAATGMRAEQLAEQELAYPTYTFIIGMEAQQLVQ